jgi:hypothetical protein
MKTFAIVVALSLASIFATACSTSETTNTTANTAPANTAPPATAPKSPSGEDVPANVRAAFPDAQSITKQHKNISSAQIAAIEKTTGSKVPDTDHHSYVAYSTTGGARKQIGAATVVEAGGMKVVVVYESRNNQPYIKEVRAESLAPAFLDQFKGKGADDKFQIGQDLKAQGVADTTAKAIATSIQIDIVTMRALYVGAQAQ